MKHLGISKIQHRELSSVSNGNMFDEMPSWKCSFQSPQTSQFEASQFHSLLIHGHPHWFGSLEFLSFTINELYFIIFALVFKLKNSSFTY